MEKNKKTSYIIALVLMGAVALLLIYCLIPKGPIPNYTTYLIATISNLLALVCGIIYVATGTKKESYLWLKFFEGFIGVSILASISRMSSMGESTVSIVLMALAFGLLCILCYADNLGKKRSYWIGIILVIIEAAKSIILLSAYVKFQMVVNQIAQLLMVIVLVLLLTYKYKDKEARGTK